MSKKEDESSELLTAAEWFSLSQEGIERGSSYYRISNILTPKGRDIHAQLDSKNLQKLVQLIIENFSKGDLNEWAHRELEGARLALTRDARGEFGRQYKLLTWATGYNVYPVEYKTLFTMTLDRGELEELEKLSFFYEEMEDLQLALRNEHIG